MVSSVFSKFAFYPTVGYTLFMAQVSSRKYYDRIDDFVVLGALPFKWMLKEELQEMEIDQLQLPTVDFVGTPSQEDLHRAVKYICEYRDRGECVYVHCKAGRTRSATVVACYLMATYGWSPEKTVDFIKSKRPHTWIREKQWNSIRTFHQSISENPR